MRDSWKRFWHLWDKKKFEPLTVEETKFYKQMEGRRKRELFTPK